MSGSATQAPNGAAVLVPLVTPVDGSGSVLAGDVRRLVESVREHASALLPALSSGEGCLLSEAQWEEVVGATCDHADGLPVYAGAEVATTEAVVDRARRARALGADGVVATTPFTSHLSPAATVTHYRTVCGEGGLPLVIYNESVLSGNVTDCTTLAACCALDGVVGVKESSGDARFAPELARQVPEASIYQGWENLLAGADGLAGCAVSLANLEPRLCRELMTAPGPSLRHQVDQACARYGLFEDDWYLHIKEELTRRGVISSTRPVTARREAP